MTKLYVGNLSDETSEKEVKEVFQAFGELEEVAVLRGYGFVHFAHSDDATAALDALDNSELCGSRLQVQFSRTKGHGYGRGSGPALPRSEWSRGGGYRSARPFPPYRSSYGYDRYDRYGYRDGYRSSYRDLYARDSYRDSYGPSYRDSSYRDRYREKEGYSRGRDYDRYLSSRYSDKDDRYDRSLLEILRRSRSPYGGSRYDKDRDYDLREDSYGRDRSRERDRDRY